MSSEVKNERVKMNLDFLSDEVPMSNDVIVAKAMEVGEKTGFTQAAPRREPIAQKPVIRKAPVRVEEPKQRRHRAKTGRTYAFNTKIRETSYDDLCLLADAYTAEEGRIVSMAEVFERAIALLKQQHASKTSSSE